MKKSLLALATLGAFAGAAQAQSSVSVYGVMDGSYTSAENESKTTAAGVSTKTNSRNTVNGAARTAHLDSVFVAQKTWAAVRLLNSF